jgi:hypothetical protein
MALNKIGNYHDTQAPSFIVAGKGQWKSPRKRENRGD